MRFNNGLNETFFFMIKLIERQIVSTSVFFDHCINLLLGIFPKVSSLSLLVQEGLTQLEEVKDLCVLVEIHVLWCVFELSSVPENLFEGVQCLLNQLWKFLFSRVVTLSENKVDLIVDWDDLLRFQGRKKFRRLDIFKFNLKVLLVKQNSFFKPEVLQLASNTLFDHLLTRFKPLNKRVISMRNLSFTELEKLRETFICNVGCCLLALLK